MRRKTGDLPEAGQKVVAYRSLRKNKRLEIWTVKNYTRTVCHMSNFVEWDAAE